MEDDPMDVDGPPVGMNENDGNPENGVIDVDDGMEDAKGAINRIVDEIEDGIVDDIDDIVDDMDGKKRVDDDDSDIEVLEAGIFDEGYVPESDPLGGPTSPANGAISNTNGIDNANGGMNGNSMNGANPIGMNGALNFGNNAMANIFAFGMHGNNRPLQPVEEEEAGHDGSKITTSHHAFNTLFLPSALPQSTEENGHGTRFLRHFEKFMRHEEWFQQETQRACANHHKKHERVLQVIQSSNAMNAAIRPSGARNSTLNLAAGTSETETRRKMKALRNTVKLCQFLDRFLKLSRTGFVGRKTLHDQLQTLRDGDCLGVWIRSQNAVMVIEKIDNTQGALYVWENQLGAKDVVIPDKIYQSLPGARAVTCWATIQSAAFSQMIEELAGNDEPRAFVHGKKGNTKRSINEADVEEEEKTLRSLTLPHPGFVSEFLLNAIGAEIDDNIEQSDVVMRKKVRDSVVTGKFKTTPWRRSSSYTALKSVTHFFCTRILDDEFLFKRVWLRLLCFTLKEVCNEGSDALRLGEKCRVSSLLEGARKIQRRLAKLDDANHRIIADQEAEEKRIAEGKKKDVEHAEEKRTFVQKKGDKKVESKNASRAKASKSNQRGTTAKMKGAPVVSVKKEAEDDNYANAKKDGRDVRVKKEPNEDDNTNSKNKGAAVAKKEPKSDDDDGSDSSSDSDSTIDIPDPPRPRRLFPTIDLAEERRQVHKAVQSVMDKVKFEETKLKEREEFCEVVLSISDVSRDQKQKLINSQKHLEKLQRECSEFESGDATRAAEDEDAEPPIPRAAAERCRQKDSVVAAGSNGTMMYGGNVMGFSRVNISMELRALDGSLDFLEKQCSKMVRLPREAKPVELHLLLHDVSDAVAKMWNLLTVPAAESPGGAVDVAGAVLTLSGLHKLMELFLKLGKEFYAPECVGENRAKSFLDIRGMGSVILTGLTACLIVDKIGCRLCPQLSKHPIFGEPQLKFTNHIFVASAEEKKQLDSIERYLQRRADSAGGNLLVPGPSNYFTSDRSFGVIYAKNDEHMKKARDMLMKKCATEQELTRVLFRQKIAQYDALESRIAGKSCGCAWSSVQGKKKKDFTCDRCKAKQQRQRIKIEPYTKILPSAENSQWTVVFELLKPEILAHVENFWVTFAVSLSPDPRKNKILAEFQHKNVTYWDNDVRIRDILQGRQAHYGVLDDHQDSIQIQSNNRRGIRIGGPHVGNSKQESVAHFRGNEGVKENTRSVHYLVNDFTGNCTNAIESLVAGIPENNAVVSNYAVVLTRSTWEWSLKHFCEPILVQPRYKSLQGFVGFGHDENQVLSKQSEAYAHNKALQGSEDTTTGSIGLREFQELGKLRAGANHQLIRLARVLQQGFVGLNHEDVSQILMAMFWQAGPALKQQDYEDMMTKNGRPRAQPNGLLGGVVGSFGLLGNLHPQNAEAENSLRLLLWRRVVGRELEPGMTTIAEDLCRHAKEVIQGAKDNWDKNVAMFNIVLLANFLHDHDPQLQEPLELLAHARRSIIGWIGKLRDTAGLCTSEEETQYFRRKICAIAVTGSLTFPPTSGSILKTPDDVDAFLFFRAVLADNVSVADYKNAAGFQRIPLLWAETRVQNLYWQLKKKLSEDSTGLTKFIRRYWTGMVGSIDQRIVWRMHALNDDKSLWFRAKVKPLGGKMCTLDMDVMVGTFLVDQAPCKRLPRGIVDHPLYERLFGNAIFNVQSLGNGYYKTAVEVGGSYFIFSQRSASSYPMIMQQRNGVMAALAPHNIFSRAKGSHVAANNASGDEGDDPGGNAVQPSGSNNMLEAFDAFLEEEEEDDLLAHEDIAGTPGNRTVPRSNFAAGGAANSAPVSGNPEPVPRPAPFLPEPDGEADVDPNAAPMPDPDGEDLSLADATLATVESDFPTLLIQNYSHWLVFQRGQWSLEFRPVRYNDPKFTAAADYVLSLSTLELWETSSEMRLLDINSRSVHLLSGKIFSKLEERLYTHVFSSLQDRGSLSVLAVTRLPRLQNLRFQILHCEVDEEDGGRHAKPNVVRAPDFGYMKVAPDQVLDTLRGLQQGLVLENDDTFVAEEGPFTNYNRTTQGEPGQEPEGDDYVSEVEERAQLLPDDRPKDPLVSKKRDREQLEAQREKHNRTADALQNRILLVPHGDVLRHSDGSVEINLNRLKKPAFFQYELRGDLRDIHPQKTRIASIFLALLHAQTARLTRDTFLNCTGTERAFEILRSGRVCGNLTNTLEKTDLDALKTEFLTYLSILRVAPLRERDSNNAYLEKSDSLTHTLEPLSAHIGFAVLAVIRIEDIFRALSEAGKRDAFEHILAGSSHARNDLMTIYKKERQKRLSDISLKSILRSSESYPELLQCAKQELMKGFADTCPNAVAHLARWFSKNSAKTRKERVDLNDGMVDGAAVPLVDGVVHSLKPWFNADQVGNLRLLGKCGAWVSQLGDEEVATLVKQTSIREEVCKHRRVFTGVNGDQKYGRIPEIKVDTLLLRQARELAGGGSGASKNEFHHIWTDLYLACRGQPNTGNGKVANKKRIRMQMTFILCRLSLDYPDAIAFLVQMSCVEQALAKHCPFPPEDEKASRAAGNIVYVKEFQNPHVNLLSDDDVEACAEAVLSPFVAPEANAVYLDDYARERQLQVAQASYDRNKKQTVRWIVEKAREAFQAESDMTPEFLEINCPHLHRIENHYSLCSSINQLFHNVRMADKLKDFAQEIQSIVDKICDNARARNLGQGNSETDKPLREKHRRSIQHVTVPPVFPRPTLFNFNEYWSCYGHLFQTQHDESMCLQKKNNINSMSTIQLQLNLSASTAVAAFPARSGKSPKILSLPQQVIPELPMAKPVMADVVQLVQQSDLMPSCGPKQRKLLSAPGDEERDPLGKASDSDRAANGHATLRLPSIVDRKEYNEVASQLMKDLVKSWNSALGEQEATLKCDGLSPEVLGEIELLLWKCYDEAQEDFKSNWRALEIGFSTQVHDTGFIATPNPTALLRKWSWDVSRVISNQKAGSADTNRPGIPLVSPLNRMNDMNGMNSMNGANATSSMKVTPTSSTREMEQLSDVRSRRVCAYAVSLRNFQRLKRLLTYFLGCRWSKFLAELKTPGGEGWSPELYPEFLAFECDNDCCIRKLQADVALEFLNGSSNRLLQMNMGEGKTAIIMPIVLAAAARGKKVTRATVLSSLFTTNVSDFQWKLGGILNRRLVPFLCRRDLKLGVAEAGQLFQEVLEVRDRGDILVQVPEHRLSLENKCMELATTVGDTVCNAQDVQVNCQIGDFVASNPRKSSCLETSSILNKLLQFLAENCSDFLDESDEILSPKYQLIYTLGEAADMAGGRVRWQAASYVLKIASELAPELLEEFGENVIEYQGAVSMFTNGVNSMNGMNSMSGMMMNRMNNVNNLGMNSIGNMGMSSSSSNMMYGAGRMNGFATAMGGQNANSHEYKAVRLLDHHAQQAAFVRLQKRIVDKIVCTYSKEMDQTESQAWRRAVLSEEPAEHFAKLSDAHKDSAYILRGLLTYEVLLGVLLKRHRVNYGAHPTRSKLNYQMAVPYLAKDVAAERTEFAHPDVALMLTVATYYQEGLTEAQLREVFVTLQNLSESTAGPIYEKWAETVNGPHVIKSYAGVNLDDRVLFKTSILPYFRKHTDVVDFWLTKKVFPHQARQFSKKLVSTAWDLCRNEETGTKSVTSGFSGTDDLKPVLPGTIQQLNLPTLSATNGLQLKSLLRPENDCYRPLISGNTAEEILQIVSEDRSITVVLDPGALVLQLSNREFSSRWLKNRPDAIAVVFFDEANSIQVMLQGSDEEIPYVLSSVSKDMTNQTVLVYLDDDHTRGSDFPLPITARGLLTLGKGLCKDKFVQACMRLRQIGAGQSLLFVASQEVDRRLAQIREEPLPSASTYDDTATDEESEKSEKLAEKDGSTKAAKSAKASESDADDDDDESEEESPPKTKGKGKAGKASAKAKAKAKAIAKATVKAASKATAKAKATAKSKAAAKKGAKSAKEVKKLDKKHDKKADSSSSSLVKSEEGDIAVDTEKMKDLKRKIEMFEMMRSTGIPLSADQMQVEDDYREEYQMLKEREQKKGTVGNAPTPTRKRSPGQPEENETLLGGSIKGSSLPGENEGPLKGSITETPHATSQLNHIPYILSWTLRNTVARICDLIPYYATQARNALKKAEARQKHLVKDVEIKDEESLKTAVAAYANDCVEDEVTDLVELYGSARVRQTLPQIVERKIKPYLNTKTRKRSTVNFATSILDKVKVLVPQVQRYGAMYDEEQERELEQELEEECQNERPPPAQPEKPFISEGLQRLRDSLYEHGRGPREGSLTHFYPLKEALFGTEIYVEPHKLAFDSSSVYVTRGFMTTVTKQNRGDQYLKMPDFCVRWKEQGNAWCTLVISNYEAETLFANSPFLKAFSAKVRLGQSPIFLKDRELPDGSEYVGLHAFAGSVYADQRLLPKLQAYFSLLPRESDLFKKFLTRQWVKPDLFVNPGEGRKDLDQELLSVYGDTNREGYQGSPYGESPVRALRIFYGQCRYLSTELATSPVGKLLGCDDLS